jgi:outer membrane protein assembly factor BamB
MVAMDVRTGKRVWMLQHLTANAPVGALATFSGGITTTDSGLLFTGNGAALSAFDDRTGNLLWTSSALPGSPWQPTIYSINGKEYIAVQSGNNAGTFAAGAAPAGGAINAVNGTSQTPTVYVYSLP